MYKLITLEMVARVPFATYQGFQKGTDLRDYLEPAITNAFKYDRRSGRYVGIKSIKPESQVWLNDRNLAQVSLVCKVECYTVDKTVDELIVAKVESIDDNANVILTDGLDNIYLHNSQIGNCYYNYQKSQLEFNNRVIKVGDLLKIRLSEKSITPRGFLRLKGTIKGPALGKKAWWQHGKD